MNKIILVIASLLAVQSFAQVIDTGAADVGPLQKIKVLGCTPAQSGMMPGILSLTGTGSRIILNAINCPAICNFLSLYPLAVINSESSGEINMTTFPLSLVAIILPVDIIFIDAPVIGFPVFESVTITA